MVAPVITHHHLLSTGGFNLTLQGPAGQHFTLLASPDLQVPLAMWTTVTNGRFGTQPTAFIDFEATNFPIRFYRLSSP
jgi:hypothetical protein